MIFVNKTDIIFKSIIPTKIINKIYQMIIKIFNIIHIFKSMTYFEDAEEDPMPKMIIPISWNEIKKYFKEEAKFASY